MGRTQFSFTTQFNTISSQPKHESTRGTIQHRHPSPQPPTPGAAASAHRRGEPPHSVLTFAVPRVCSPCCQTAISTTHRTARVRTCRLASHAAHDDVLSSSVHVCARCVCCCSFSLSLALSAALSTCVLRVASRRVMCAGARVDLLDQRRRVGAFCPSLADPPESGGVALRGSSVTASERATRANTTNTVRDFVARFVTKLARLRACVFSASVEHCHNTHEPTHTEKVETYSHNCWRACFQC